MKNLKVVESVGNLSVVRGKRSPDWILSSNGPKTIDDLPFFARDGEGRTVWWKVDPPKTNYESVHRTLGKAYAIDLIDYIHASQLRGEKGSGNILGFIALAMLRQNMDWRGQSICEGFWATIGEYLTTGTVDR